LYRLYAQYELHFECDEDKLLEVEKEEKEEGKNEEVNIEN